MSESYDSSKHSAANVLLHRSTTQTSGGRDANSAPVFFLRIDPEFFCEGESLDVLPVPSHGFRTILNKLIIIAEHESTMCRGDLEL